jgi:hypothetical protein
LRGWHKLGMIDVENPFARNGMSTHIRETRAKKMLKANESVVCMGSTPRIRLSIGRGTRGEGEDKAEILRLAALQRSPWPTP